MKIIGAEIISRPLSGEYSERIYDNQSPWNSGHWSYIKFMISDYEEWCGVFRGKAFGVEISETKKELLILTSDYIWQLDQHNGDVIDVIDNLMFNNVTITPDGNYYVLSDYYNLYRIANKLSNLDEINSPKGLDMIKFRGWENEKLLIECDEFTNWDNHMKLELDATNWIVRITEESKPSR